MGFGKRKVLKGLSLRSTPVLCMCGLFWADRATELVLGRKDAELSDFSVGTLIVL